jgi:hypothetical protein
MISFTNSDYKNLHIDLKGEVAVVTVSLNVTKEASCWLGSLQQDSVSIQKPKINTSLKGKYYVAYCSNKTTIITEQNILKIANYLINYLMQECRKAKILVIKDEIVKLQNENSKTF